MDKPVLRLLPALAAGLLIGFSGPAARAQQAAPYTQIVVFGDSLSDDGNVASRAEADYGLRFPGPLFNYTDGRFTDGSDTSPQTTKYTGVWHEQLAAMFSGLKPATDGEDGGTDYAFGAATTTDDSTTISDGSLTLTIDNIGKQVSDYLAAHAPDPHALYIVWGGANDLYADDSAAGVSGAARREAALVTQLGQAGAHVLLIPNLPPLGDVPGESGDPATAAALDEATAAYNTQLAAALNVAQFTFTAQNLPVKIYRLDVSTLFGSLAKNPAAFGFADIMDSAQGLSVNPDQYLFWDSLHPTTAGHHQIALAAYQALTSGEDTMPPVTTASVTRLTTGSQITLTAKDNLSGIAVRYYSLDGGAQAVYTAPLLVSRNGARTLSYHSVDKAGNVEAARTLSLTVAVALPVTTVTLTGTPGTNGYDKNAVTVLLAAKAGGLPVAHKYDSLDGGPTQTYLDQFAVSSDGIHTLTYDSADTAGNKEAIKSITFKIDKTKPTTTATLYKTITGEKVALSASDALSGIASTVYAVDNGAVLSYAAPFIVTGKGTHTIIFHSTDRAGNTEGSKTVAFINK